MHRGMLRERVRVWHINDELMTGQAVVGVDGGVCRVLHCLLLLY
jgi:hypothetical protein